MHSECLPKAGQCVSVADLVTPGLLLLSCLPREAINKEIMAEQFTHRLWVSLLPFKCANHFFHYCTLQKERERRREKDKTMMGKYRGLVYSAFKTEKKTQNTKIQGVLSFFHIQHQEI